jgi:hypothetical protein
MTERARRRRDLLDELERVRRLHLGISPRRARRAQQLWLQRITRLSL